MCGSVSGALGSAWRRRRSGGASGLGKPPSHRLSAWLASRGGVPGTPGLGSLGRTPGRSRLGSRWGPKLGQQPGKGGRRPSLRLISS